MEELNPEDHGAYQIPLTDAQLIGLAKIAVVWGHVDSMLDELILYAYEIDNDQRKALIGEKPIGAKADILAKRINHIKPKETRALTQRFLELIQATKTERNAAFHGQWGYKLDKRKPNEFAVAVHYPPSPNNPLTPARFPAILKLLNEASRKGELALTQLKGWPPSATPGLYCFGGGDNITGPPGWLQQSHGAFGTGRSPRDRNPPIPDNPSTTDPE
jgi:hypothetical protein